MNVLRPKPITGHVNAASRRVPTAVTAQEYPIMSLHDFRQHIAALDQRLHDLAAKYALLHRQCDWVQP